MENGPKMTREEALNYGKSNPSDRTGEIEDAASERGATPWDATDASLVAHGVNALQAVEVSEGGDGSETDKVDPEDLLSLITD